MKPLRDINKIFLLLGTLGLTSCGNSDMSGSALNNSKGNDASGTKTIQSDSSSSADQRKKAPLDETALEEAKKEVVDIPIWTNGSFLVGCSVYPSYKGRTTTLNCGINDKDGNRIISEADINVDFVVESPSGEKPFNITANIKKGSPVESLVEVNAHAILESFVSIKANIPDTAGYRTLIKETLKDPITDESSLQACLNNISRSPLECFDFSTMEPRVQIHFVSLQGSSASSTDVELDVQTDAPIILVVTSHLSVRWTVPNKKNILQIYASGLNVQTLASNHDIPFEDNSVRGHGNRDRMTRDIIDYPGPKATAWIQKVSEWTGITLEDSYQSLDYVSKVEIK